MANRAGKEDAPASGRQHAARGLLRRHQRTDGGRLNGFGRGFHVQRQQIPANTWTRVEKNHLGFPQFAIHVSE
jgi:hypothetical protein